MTRLIRLAIAAAAVLAIAGGCSVPEDNTSQLAPDAGTPGWTGRRLVVGSHSSVAGDATARQQNWSAGGAGGGGGGGGGM
jgi:hypothetical protein